MEKYSDGWKQAKEDAKKALDEGTWTEKFAKKAKAKKSKDSE
jgi:hypothetical protein